MIYFILSQTHRSLGQGLVLKQGFLFYVMHEGLKLSLDKAFFVLGRRPSTICSDAYLSTLPFLPV